MTFIEISFILHHSISSPGKSTRNKIANLSLYLSPGIRPKHGYSLSLEAQANLGISLANMIYS